MAESIVDLPFDIAPKVEVGWSRWCCQSWWSNVFCFWESNMAGRRLFDKHFFSGKKTSNWEDFPAKTSMDDYRVESSPCMETPWNTWISSDQVKLTHVRHIGTRAEHSRLQLNTIIHEHIPTINRFSPKLSYHKNISKQIWNINIQQPQIKQKIQY